MVELYQQAKPLVHPHSSAAIKTLGKMLDDAELMRRMLQRNQKFAGVLGGRKVMYEPPPSSSSDAHHTATERLEFMAVCAEMMTHFDPQARRSREIRLATVKQLLGHYGLHVDDVAYRRWEQRLPEETEKISLTMFIQACLLWFSEKLVLEHFKKFKEERIRSHSVPSPGGADSKQQQLLLEKSHSAPHLHPFDQMKQQHDTALTFSFEKCAKRPPVRYALYFASPCC